jgi:hypothetical protein
LAAFKCQHNKHTALSFFQSFIIQFVIDTPRKVAKRNTLPEVSAHLVYKHTTMAQDQVINAHKILQESQRIAGLNRRIGPQKLTDVEYRIMEEALRAAGIPNLPSGGIPGRDLTDSQIMLLNATINNLTIKERQKTVPNLPTPTELSEQELLKQIRAVKEAYKKQKEEDDLRAKEALEKEPILDQYFRPIINYGGSAYMYTTGPGEMPPWNVAQKQFSSLEIIKAAEEIEQYREYIKPKVEEYVNICMSHIWKDSDEIFINNHAQGGYIINRDNNLDRYGVKDIPQLTNPDGTPFKDGWKRTVLNTMFYPKFCDAHKLWVFYVNKRIERNKTSKQPANLEYLTKIKDLESKLEEEKNKTKLLEDKIARVKGML